ncbi:hypothetical protein E4U44_003032 [Claviceps purpurea]|nr:hypothetical protein E4U44_003032 [Claviceps purpurea]
MDDAISWGVAAISVLRQLSAQHLQACHQQDSAAQSKATVRHGLLRKREASATQGSASRGTDPNVAYAERERPVARDEHILVLGRALSDEVVGEQTFYPDAVCADCLEEVEIRDCRHHGRGGFFLARGNGEASKCSEFDSLEQW